MLKITQLHSIAMYILYMYYAAIITGYFRLCNNSQYINIPIVRRSNYIDPTIFTYFQKCDLILLNLDVLCTSVQLVHCILYSMQCKTCTLYNVQCTCRCTIICLKVSSIHWSRLSICLLGISYLLLYLYFRYLYDLSYTLNHHTYNNGIALSRKLSIVKWLSIYIQDHRTCLWCLRYIINISNHSYFGWQHL